MDAFELAPSLTVTDGIVIGPSDTRRVGKGAVQTSRRTQGRVHYFRACAGDPAAAAPAASAGSTIIFWGICPGPIHIDADIRILGTTLSASSDPVDGGPISRSSSGRPAVKRPGDEPSIVVSATVDDLRLGFRVHDGLRIGPCIP